MKQTDLNKANPPAKLDPFKVLTEYSVDPDWDEVKQGELHNIGEYFNGKESYN